MRQGILLCVLVFIVHGIATGQYRLSGYIFDEVEQPHEYIPIRVESDSLSFNLQTNQHGRFELENIPRDIYHIHIISAYGIVRKEVNLKRSVEMVITVPRTIRMDEVLVKASRVDEKMPFTYKNLDRDELEIRNLGQDVPYTLKWTPSVVVTSDAGTGIGYTGIRVRGSDPTRTNVTINGIPLNDAESQAVFWVDLPDFVSSTESIQIQRGVGTSTNGAAAFGASINLNTTKLNKDAYAEANVTAGSFNTLKTNLLFGTGLLNERWTFDGRLSRITSDGYIDRAEATLNSFSGSAAYYGNYSSIRFNVFHGDELTYQAWNGVPAQYIDDPELRTFNTAGAERAGQPYDNEVDDYKQTHYQLLYHFQMNSFLRAQGALHYTRGKGFFEQYKADQDLAEYLFEEELTSDLVRRRWLDNHFFGATGNLNLKGSRTGIDADLGGAFHRYLGRHFGEVIWTSEAVSQEAEAPYYDNDASKNDGNIYFKVQLPLSSRLGGYIDLQQRWISYTFLGINPIGDPLEQTVNLGFFNPKFGLNYAFAGEKGNAYVSYAVAHKEPNRDDYTESTINSRPRPERLQDLELGVRLNRKNLELGINGYWMDYKDQIVPTGRLNDVGAATRQNVDDSYRLGIELDATWNVTKKLTIAAQQTLSRNKIRSFTEYIDNWDYWSQDFENTPPELLEPLQYEVVHENTDLAYSPNIVSALILGYRMIDVEKVKVDIELANKYVGKQYLDNTSNERASLDGYYYADARVSVQFSPKWAKEIGLNFQLNNLFNNLYSANGWVYRFRSAGYNPIPDDPYVVEGEGDRYNMIGYFPQATRNVLASLQIRF